VEGGAREHSLARSRADYERCLSALKARTRRQVPGRREPATWCCGTRHGASGCPWREEGTSMAFQPRWHDPGRRISGRTKTRDGVPTVGLDTAREATPNACPWEKES